MQDYAYYNGVFCPYDSMSLPLSDRSIFFGDAVYDVMIGARGIPYQIDDHLDRLMINAARIGLLDIPEKNELLDIISELIELSHADEFTVYVQLSGYGERRSHRRCDGRVNLLVTVTETAIPSALESVNAVILPDIRHRLCDVKTTNLLAAVMSVNHASNNESDIAIFERDGYVTECSYANICLIKNGRLICHPFNSDILPGITQKNILSICGGLGVATEEREIRTCELYDADAVIISSTTKFIRLCDKICGIQLKDENNALTKQIFNELRRNFWIQIMGDCTF